MERATLKDAPTVLNTNDKAMWVLGFNAALDATSVPAPNVVAELSARCTRSHPHENMSPDCERLTVIAREQNAAARGVPAVPHLSLCSSQDDTMRGYPVCDCGADYENRTRTAAATEPSLREETVYEKSARWNWPDGRPDL